MTPLYSIFEPRQAFDGPSITRDGIDGHVTQESNASGEIEADNHY